MTYFQRLYLRDDDDGNVESLERSDEMKRSVAAQKGDHDGGVGHAKARGRRRRRLKEESEKSDARGLNGQEQTLAPSAVQWLEKRERKEIVKEIILLLQYLLH